VSRVLSCVVLLLLLRQPPQGRPRPRGVFPLGAEPPAPQTADPVAVILGIADTIFGAWLQSTGVIFAVFSLTVDLMLV
jgi:hypothetical protein